MQVKWPGHGSPWPTFEVPPKPKTITRTYNSVTEAILHELYRKYDKWRNPTIFHGIDVEKEIIAALSDDIVKEIDAEILKDLMKAIKIPKDKL